MLPGSHSVFPIHLDDRFWKPQYFSPVVTLRWWPCFLLQWKAKTKKFSEENFARLPPLYLLTQPPADTCVHIVCLPVRSTAEPSVFPMLLRVLIARALFVSYTEVPPLLHSLSIFPLVLDHILSIGQHSFSSLKKSKPFDTTSASGLFICSAF